MDLTSKMQSDPLVIERKKDWEQCCNAIVCTVLRLSRKLSIGREARAESLRKAVSVSSFRKRLHK